MGFHVQWTRFELCLDIILHLLLDSLLQSLSNLFLAGFQDSNLSSLLARFYCLLGLIHFHIDALQFCLKEIKNIFKLRIPLCRNPVTDYYIWHPFICKSKNKPKKHLKMPFFCQHKLALRTISTQVRSMKLLFSSITAFSSFFFFWYTLAVS